MSINKGLIRLGFNKDDYLLKDYSDGKGVVITWLSDKVQPSDAEIKASSDAWQAEYDNNKYQRDRKPNYPPMTDYLDGIVKGDQAQIDKYIADCLAVKEKYPKGVN